jgi:Predicted membrane protein
VEVATKTTGARVEGKQRGGSEPALISRHPAEQPGDHAEQMGTPAAGTPPAGPAADRRDGGPDEQDAEDGGEHAIPQPGVQQAAGESPHRAQGAESPQHRPVDRRAEAPRPERTRHRVRDHDGGDREAGPHARGEQRRQEASDPEPGDRRRGSGEHGHDEGEQYHAPSASRTS